MRIRTKDGDMLDAICKTHLGSEQTVPAVLDANPGLAALGAVYAAGVRIDLPAAAPAATIPRIRLWGRG